MGHIQSIIIVHVESLNLLFSILLKQLKFVHLKKRGRNKQTFHLVL